MADLPFAPSAVSCCVCCVQEAVQEAVHDAVQQAIEENVQFDVRANFYTLVAVTGVSRWGGASASASSRAVRLCEAARAAEELQSRASTRLHGPLQHAAATCAC